MAPSRGLRRAFSWIVVAVALAGVARGEIPEGSDKIEVDLGSVKLNVFTYKPKDYDDGPLILVFHGVNRNADEYRDDARAMADRFGAIVAAPEFDKARFPSSKYHQGGLLDDKKQVRPREDWTWTLVPKLADAIRVRAGRPDKPYYLIGHSAGAQFLGRMMAFADPGKGAVAVIAANPSAWVQPNTAQEFPYGLGGLPEELRDEAAVRRYLARPMVVYLGGADDERDDYLDKSAEADVQGRTRLRRGRHQFEVARDLARAKGWPFAWRLVEAGGVDHDHGKMFDHPACAEAIFGDKVPVGVGK